MDWSIYSCQLYNIATDFGYFDWSSVDDETGACFRNILQMFEYQAIQSFRAFGREVPVEFAVKLSQRDAALNGVGAVL